MSRNWHHYVETFPDTFNVQREIQEPELRSLISQVTGGVIPKRIKNMLLSIPFETRQRLVNSWYCKGLINKIIEGNKLRDMKFLVEECGADVNLEGFNYDDERRLTAPIDVAIVHGNEQMIEYMISKGATSSFMIFQLITLKDVNKVTLRLLDMFLERCGPIDITHPVTGETPLLCAAMKDSLPWIEALISRGASIVQDRGLDVILLATLFDKQNLLEFFERKGYRLSGLREIETLEMKGAANLLNESDNRKTELGISYLTKALELRAELGLRRPAWRSGQAVFQDVKLYESVQELSALQYRHTEGHADLIVQCLLLVERIAGKFPAVIGEGVLNNGSIFKVIRFANDVVEILTYMAGGFSLNRFNGGLWIQLFSKLVPDAKTRTVAEFVLKLLQGGTRALSECQVREFTHLVWSLIEKSEEAPDIERQLESLKGDGLLHASLIYAAIARRHRCSSWPSIEPYREAFIRALLQKGAFIGLPGYAGSGSAFWRVSDMRGERLCDIIRLAACCRLDLTSTQFGPKVPPLRCLAARLLCTLNLLYTDELHAVLIGQKRDIPIPMEAFIASHRPFAADLDWSYYSTEPTELLHADYNHTPIGHDLDQLSLNEARSALRYVPENEETRL